MVRRNAARARRSDLAARSRPGTEKARARHRPRHLRRLPRLRDSLQGMEHRRPHGAAARLQPLWRRAPGASGSTASTPSRKARARARAPSISRDRACIARSRPASPSARPAPPTSAPRTASCWSTKTICIGCKLCSWACPYGAREFDADEGVMKKCTLCIDRIYNENLPEPKIASRPASWSARSARGISAISAIPTRRSRSWSPRRGGGDLMPELGYRPVNKYLPPRPGRMAAQSARAPSRWRCRADGARPPTGCCAGSTALSVPADATKPMHPALSIIFFTTASGAGFALLLLLGLGAPLGLLPRQRRLRLCRASGRSCARGRRARLLGLSSRPAGAGVARLLAMAIVVAVARGRLLGR